MTPVVGFLGLGAMGRGMARNLHRAGFLKCVWNRTPSVATQLATELDVVAGRDPADLASRCNIIVLCVSADADVLELVDAMLESRDVGLRNGGSICRVGFRGACKLGSQLKKQIESIFDIF